MKKDRIKRPIRIPLWRVDDIEAWLAGMSAKGLELTGITGGTAIFRRSEPQRIRFYCHILETCKEEHIEKIKEDRDSQIQQVAALGFIPIGGNEHIHVFRCDGACRYPIPPEEETERVVALYKRTSKKVSATLGAMLLLMLKVGTSLLDPLNLLTMPGGLTELFALAAALIGFVALLINKTLTVRRIRETYQVQPPHQRTYDPSPDAIQRHYHIIAWSKRLLVGMVAYVLLLGPLASWGYEALTKGNNPPIPAGDLPVVRISDIHSDLPVSASSTVSEANYYHSRPSLLIPEFVNMHETTPDTWLYSRKYKALSRWYADLVALAAKEEALGDPVEHDSPAIYGLDRILYEKSGDSYHHIIAQKGSTVYDLVCLDDTTTNEELFAVIGKKADQ